MLYAAQVTIGTLAILILVGGLIGFIKAKSKASIIAASISSLLLFACLLWSMQDLRTGLIAGDAVTFLLAIMFTIRLRKTGKYMPNGVMQLLSLASLAIVTLALVRG